MNLKLRQTSVKLVQSCLVSKSIKLAFACAGVLATALLPACGGNDPEPRMFEQYFQAQSGGGGNKCELAAKSFAQSATPFQKQIIETAWGYQVSRSECRYSPQPVEGNCYAQYKFTLIVPPDDKGRVEQGIRFGVFQGVNKESINNWGAFNSPLAELPLPSDVSFPPSFTPGYLDCGAP
jgi:hypothetical protein